MTLKTGLGPTKTHHEWGIGAQGQFLLSFEDCFDGISASLDTIFCGGGKGKMRGWKRNGKKSGDS